MALLPEDLRLAAADVDGLHVHDIVRMARSELLQAEHGDTGRPRHDEMCRRDRDIRWQVDLAADAARSDVAEQHDFAPRLCALCEDLRDGQDLHRIDDMQRALFRALGSTPASK